MVVDLPIEGDLQVDLSLREGEALADQRRRQTAATSVRSVLQLLDHQSNAATLVALLFIVFTNVDLDRVFHTKWLTLIILTGLQRNRAWGHVREVECEWVCILAQLLDQALLHGGHLHLGVHHGIDLLLAQDHLLGKLDPHDLILFATITVHSDEL